MKHTESETKTTNHGPTSTAYIWWMIYFSAYIIPFVTGWFVRVHVCPPSLLKAKLSVYASVIVRSPPVIRPWVSDSKCTDVIPADLPLRKNFISVLSKALLASQTRGEQKKILKFEFAPLASSTMYANTLRPRILVLASFVWS